MIMLKPYPLLRYAVDCGRGRSIISIAAQMIRPQTVNVKIDDSHICLLAVVFFHEVYHKTLRLTRREGEAPAEP